MATIASCRRHAFGHDGRTDYRPKGDPKRVKVHDLQDKELGKVVPFGVYDIAVGNGWVCVVLEARLRHDITHDTAEFAEARRRDGAPVVELIAATTTKTGRRSAAGRFNAPLLPPAPSSRASC